MGTESIIILTLALGFGFYMAWNIGANDMANAMGTSIGSGALTMKKAILIAAVFEFAGAFLVGSHVTETVRKGIIDLSIFTEMENGTSILMYGCWLHYLRQEHGCKLLATLDGQFQPRIRLLVQSLDLGLLLVVLFGRL